MFGGGWGIILLAYTPWLLALGGAFYLGLRIVRALERRNQSGADLAAIRERLALVEESVSSMSERVDRLADGHEFTARFLAERK